MADADTSVTVWQGEFELLPPDPWDGQAPDPPIGAMRPQVVETEGQRGRRPGSTNRRADDFASYVARRDGSPLEHLAQLVAMPISELAREMRVRPLVAAKFHSRMASLLARYTLTATPRPVVITARGGGVSEFCRMHYAAASAAAERLKQLQPEPANAAPVHAMVSDGGLRTIGAFGAASLPPGEVPRTMPADSLAIARAAMPPKGKD